MKKPILAAFVSFILITAGCAKTKDHCYRCIDLGQVDQAFDVCSNDTSTAGRHAYVTLSSGQHLNNTNGMPDSCMAYDK